MEEMDPFNLLVILGATATGKTRVAVQVARALGGEIISADSRQVYRGMDIGTGKDLAEYAEVLYHLIDIRDPAEEFSVFDFKKSFVKASEAIRGRGRLPVLAGGTGLYLESVLLDYRMPEVAEDGDLRGDLSLLSMAELIARLRRVKPDLHNTTDLTDRERLVRALEISESAFKNPPPPGGLSELKPVVFGINWDRQVLRRRITQRLRERLDGGMIAEVRNLHRQGLPFDKLEFYGLEYRYAALFLKGELSRNDLFQKLTSAIHQFAKRQETWFRRMERRGVAIHWVEGNGEPAEAILKFIRKLPPIP
jgi:tRNA dimethylallyltransferase